MSRAGRSDIILSASVAFVALSGEAEYAYACVFASAATASALRRLKAPLRAVNEDVMAVVQSRFLRESPARSSVEPGRRAAEFGWCGQELQRVGECDGRHRRRIGIVRTRACVLRQRGGMRRSGALTLGVVLTLGAVTGGRGQELSSSVTSAERVLLRRVCSACGPGELGGSAVEADRFPNCDPTTRT